jgi:magnesium transporter
MDEQTRPFFGDIYDHVLRVLDHVEAYDRLLTDVLHAHLAQISVQQNDDMRRISAWVAMAAVPTMVAGIYGMNFDYMPELRYRPAYFIVLGVLAVVEIGLYRAFRKSGWL